VGIFPIPSSTGNLITLNYKTRIPDLNQADYTTGTVGITTNTTIVTGALTVWTKSMLPGGWIRINPDATDAKNGDNQWYEIDSITDGTHLVLKNPYTGTTVAGGTYTIGQAPLLPEDYQDLPLYRMAILYYTTRFPDPNRAALYQGLWDKGEAALDEEFGAKTTNVALTDTDASVMNPNLFQRTVT
jgi:hypothetical protein